MNPSDFESEHRFRALSEADFSADPLAQFHDWYERALRSELPQPDAAALATADRDGRPSARMVLLRGYDAAGFVFYTNYRSRKGEDLAANPYAALLFYWPALDRQVRIEGPAERVSAAESDAYFRTRPWESRIAALASPQSQVEPDRTALATRFAELASRHQGGDVPRPEHWGGFRMRPESLEFWQGRAHRLHDRLRYRRAEGDAWRLERLAP